MRDSKFTVCFAQNDDDMKKVYKLRYEDLVLEYNEDSSFLNGDDKNAYDDYADHLVVKDNESGEIVGYYRMIRSDVLKSGQKFICEDEFDVSKLKASGDKICEFSRAVIKKNHRGGIVLILLWKFILEFMKDNGYRYLIGDASFFGTDREKYKNELSYLINSFPIDEKWGITSLDSLPPMELLKNGEYDEELTMKNLPPLIKAYLNLGAKVSTQTFTDVPFGSVDVFILVDLLDCNQSFIDKICKF